MISLFLSEHLYNTSRNEIIDSFLRAHAGAPVGAGRAPASPAGAGRAPGAGEEPGENHGRK